ncbi:peptidoglycan-binding domain-containing protein [Arthrobacter sunyaminii]|uniref:Peptidoglycan binding-like domain-containing protein n=1 Tax=Arthrobacter sunyaminii TaxID=2816859 RepID=A0A975PCD0_9MICC|nr:hypothetical protein [Arthrobacter sunyaminii]MBO0895831.1 hypothetical protein [Arthrobacter sunyaminii]MBO0907484.1 hypothetical protein [Arthrobacter sunyaminii]QWQ35060.1 hypothetical protein KG104_11050 [Arthrobacter sunyaminii]
MAAEPGTARPHRKYRRGTVALALCVATLILGAAGGTFLVAPQLKTAEQAAADALPPPARPVTASVEQRVLTEETVLRGIISSGDSTPVVPSAALAATSPVITAVPVTAGSSISPGTTVLEANGEPVFAMDWNFAPYRNITGGSRGPDVVQLQNTLADLGYATSLSGVLDPLTQSGLSMFYTDRGYTAPVAGTDNALAASGSGAKISGTVVPDVVADPETSAPSSGGASLPAASVVLIPSGLHTVTQVLPGVGSYLAEPAQPLLRLNAGANIAVAVLDAGTAATYAAGDEAVLTDSRDDTEHPLEVSSVGTEPMEVPGVGNGIKVVFSFSGTAPAPTPEGSTLLIRVTLAGDPEPVVAVPVTALYARSDGTSFVTVAADPQAGTDSLDVTVTPGRDIGGWVAIAAENAESLPVGSIVVVGMTHEQ